MKLYTMIAAPNPAKVMLYLAERREAGADLPVELVEINPFEGELNGEAHLARSPFGTVPVLELDDGSYIFESLVIIDYLEEKFPDHAMLPVNLEARAHAKALERTVESRIMLPMTRFVHATNSPLGLPADPKLAAQIKESLPKSLAYIEGKLSDGRELLTGEAVSIADCTMQAGFQFARFGQADLISDFPHIVAWDERFRQRPAAKSVLNF